MQGADNAPQPQPPQKQRATVVVILSFLLCAAYFDVMTATFGCGSSDSGQGAADSGAATDTGSAGCAKDTDCKGTRICVAGQCVDQASDGQMPLPDANGPDGESADGMVADATGSDGPLSDVSVDAPVADAYVPDASIPDAYVPDANLPDTYAPADVYALPDSYLVVADGYTCWPGNAACTANSECCSGVCLSTGKCQ